MKWLKKAWNSIIEYIKTRPEVFKHNWEEFKIRWTYEYNKNKEMMNNLLGVKK